VYPIDLVKPSGLLLYACKLRINVCQTFQPRVSAGKQNEPDEVLCICRKTSLNAVERVATAVGAYEQGMSKPCFTRRFVTEFRGARHWILF
jgi:hypothetical protein